MARYYRVFKTKEELKAWETEKKKKDPKFRVCMRMTAKQLQKYFLPYVIIEDYKYAIIWTNE